MYCGCKASLALFPGDSQILSHSCGEKLGEGLVPLLHHRPEMVLYILLDGPSADTCFDTEQCTYPQPPALLGGYGTRPSPQL